MQDEQCAPALAKGCPSGGRQRGPRGTRAKNRSLLSHRRKQEVSTQNSGASASPSPSLEKTHTHTHTTPPAPAPGIQRVHCSREPSRKAPSPPPGLLCSHTLPGHRTAPPVQTLWHCTSPGKTRLNELNPEGLLFAPEYGSLGWHLVWKTDLEISGRLQSPLTARPQKPLPRHT